MQSIRVLLILLLALPLAGCRDTPSGGMTGQTAPDFTFNDGARAVSLHDFRGKIVLLNFWATWCAPCIQEIPSLIRLQNRMGDKVVIFAVSVDTDEAAYRKFLRDRNVTLTTVRGDKGKIDDLYAPTGYPETYVLDRSGKILRKFIGAQQWDSEDFIQYLNKL